MASVTEIRDAIKTTIGAAITSLHIYDTVPDSPELPALIVQPTLSDFHVAMGRGTDRWEFDLIVLVSWGDSDLAQDQLDGYITGAGASSIRQAVFNARTLGLTAVDATIAGLSEYGIKTAAAIDHVGAVLRLVVHTSGTS